jgi:hypothetical protein
VKTKETLNLEFLRQRSMLGRYWYVASPYSKYPLGTRRAYQDVCEAAAWLLKQGVHVFCPIAHSHPISTYGGIDPESHDIWLPADKPFMDAAVGLIICEMESWEDSYGVGFEIDEFYKAAKPVIFMAWPRKE